MTRTHLKSLAAEQQVRPAKPPAEADAGRAKVRPAAPSAQGGAGRRRAEMIDFFITRFEPLVIRAMNLYTTTSSVPLQQQVLFLLCRLMVLRVNYTMLDKDRVFVSAVERQLEMVGAGQIRSPQNLLFYIFQYFVLLSQDNSTIMPLEAVVQRAVELSHSPHLQPNHIVQAVKPLVHNLFVQPFRQMKSINGSTPLTPLRLQMLDMLLNVRHATDPLRHFVPILMWYSHPIPLAPPTCRR